jgi:hypothetical protein
MRGVFGFKQSGEATDSAMSLENGVPFAFMSPTTDTGPSRFISSATSSLAAKRSKLKTSRGFPLTSVMDVGKRFGFYLRARRTWNAMAGRPGYGLRMRGDVGITLPIRGSRIGVTT